MGCFPGWMGPAGFQWDSQEMGGASSGFKTFLLAAPVLDSQETLLTFLAGDGVSDCRHWGAWESWGKGADVQVPTIWCLCPTEIQASLCRASSLYRGRTPCLSVTGVCREANAFADTVDENDVFLQLKKKKISALRCHIHCYFCSAGS